MAYSVITLWVFELFLLLAIINAMNTCIQVFVWTYDFISLGYTSE